MICRQYHFAEKDIHRQTYSPDNLKFILLAGWNFYIKSFSIKADRFSVQIKSEPSESNFRRLACFTNLTSEYYCPETNAFGIGRSPF